MNNFKKMVISIVASLQIQQSELGELKKAFLFLDSNLDGVLTIDELANGINKLNLFELLQDSTKENEDCYQQVMKKCDLDGDGKIDYAEFIQATIEHKALLNEENIRLAFKMFDLNGDGSISIDELRHMFSDKIVNS